MNTPPRKNAAKLALLLPLLMVTACGSRPQSSPPPVVGEKPTAQPLPSSIAGIAPPPSGYYWNKLTARRKSSQAQLNSTPMKSEP